MKQISTVQARADHATYGIQGGRGSFNEEAVQYFLKKSQIEKFNIKYLYTSEAVLKALQEGKIDYGQFAIHNSVGGIVSESIEAMASYKFKIIEQFSIKISHALMIRRDAEIEDVKIIMSHPQVFAQCQQTLFNKYSGLKLTPGKGKLVDHALVAKRLSEGKLPKNTATMGSQALAQMYHLKIVENNLQDQKDNYTSFLLVGRA
ncbi:prephenate dehydratase domain-containing protein [Patescibacteria group bacterium]